jgi:hypothetical protein
MNIGMAHAAEENVDLDIKRAGIAAFDGNWNERGREGFDTVGFDFGHNR